MRPLSQGHKILPLENNAWKQKQGLETHNCTHLLPGAKGGKVPCRAEQTHGLQHTQSTQPRKPCVHGAVPKQGKHGLLTNPTHSPRPSQCHHSMACRSPTG